MINNDFSNVNLSFAGCGFLCIYHAGVVAAIKEYAPQMARNRLYGASAGSIAAVCLACNLSISDATSAILQVVCEARAGTLKSISPTFDLIGLVKDGLEKMLPDNAHLLCADKVFISLTRHEDLKNVIISKFLCKKDLIEAVLCSCFIPYFCGLYPPLFRGTKYIDGGFSNNQPTLDKQTITISPFSGESDICPLDFESASLLDFVYYNSSFRINTANLNRLFCCLLPPSQDICSQICRQGFSDTLRYLTKNALTPCAKCLTIKSNVVLRLDCSQRRDLLQNLQEESPLINATKSLTRRRLDSECEICLEKMEPSLHSEISTQLFPSILQKTLDETQAAEYRLIGYLKSFRIIHWATDWVKPVRPFIQYTTVVAKLITEWIKSPYKGEFAMKQLIIISDMILKEIEEKSLICSPKLLSQITNTHKSNQNIININQIIKPINSRRREEDRICNYEQYLDSIYCLIENERNQDAILAYHYIDEKKNVHFCQLLDKSDDYYFNSNVGYNRIPTSPIFSKTFLSTMPEEVEEYCLEKENAKHQAQIKRLKSSSYLTNEDSGVSLGSFDESSYINLCTNKRDACCSPVKCFIPAPSSVNIRNSHLRMASYNQLQRGQIPGQARRSTTIDVPSSLLPISNNGANLRGKYGSNTRIPLVTNRSKINSGTTNSGQFCSSDSDADVGDELFVSMRRKRTSSNEYDGEPSEGPSDA